MPLLRILFAPLMLALWAQLAAAPAFAADAGVCSWDSVRNIGALLRQKREAAGRALASGARPSSVGGTAVTKPKLLDEKVDKALARFERPVAAPVVHPKASARLKASEEFRELTADVNKLRAIATPLKRPPDLSPNAAAGRKLAAAREPAPAPSASWAPQVTRGPPVEELRAGQSADVLPSRLITSQPDVGKALLGHYLGEYIGTPALRAVGKNFKLPDPRNPAHRKVYREAVAGSLRQMGRNPRPGFVGPDLNNPGRRVLMIEDATHRSTQSHMLTSAEEWKNLPPSMRAWLGPEDLDAFGRIPETHLRVEVKKVYDTADEMAFDFARSGRGLLPETLETGASLEARAFREAREAAQRARNVGELAKVEREALVEGYRLATREIGEIGDDPLRSAVGRLFDNYKGFSDNGKTYLEFDVGRALSEPQLRDRIRALEVTNQNFDSVPVQEALAHYLFDDPRVVRDFLRPLARPGKEKEFNGILDQIVSRRLADGAAEKAGIRIAEAEAQASRKMAFHEKEARRYEQGLQTLRRLDAAGKIREGSLQARMLKEQTRLLEASMAEVSRARDSLAAAASFRLVNDPSVVARGPVLETLIKDVDRLPANVRMTQDGYGKAQVLGTLAGRAAAAAGKGRTPAERLSHFADDLFKLSEREVPAVRGPPLKGSGRPVIYITDGHHSGMQLYMLAHGRFDALPAGVQRLFRDASVNFYDWQKANRHRLLVNPRIEKTYNSTGELVADWVRTGRGLLSGDLEKSLSGELARARQALKLEPEEVAGLGPAELRRLELEKLQAVDPADMRRLVEAYSNLPDGFRSLKDDPVRSTVGEAFQKLGLGADMVVYSQFRVYRDSPAFQARLDEILADANRKYKGVNNLLLRPASDPERTAFLSSVSRALLDPDTDTPAVLSRMAKPSHEAQAANLEKLLKAQREFHPQLRESGKLAAASAPAGRVPASARPSAIGDALADPRMGPPVARFQHSRVDIPGLPTLADLGPDRRVSEVVAEQARLLTQRRERAYRQMLAADPKSTEIRTFDTIVVGGGPQGVTMAANLKGTRTLMINAGDRAGTFADFGDTFVVNSNETFGQASTNIIPGGAANAQVRNLAKVTPGAGDVYVTGRTIGDATDLQLALTDAEVLTKTPAAEPVFDKKLGLWKVETNEGPFYARNVARGTGLGEEKFTFAPDDKTSWGIVAAEKKAGTHRVEFINHFMKRMQLASEEGVNPLAKLPGKSYVVVGGGDGGAIVAKYLTGLGPPEGYGGRALQAGEGQKKVFWFGQKSADRAAYEQSTWGPYLDLGPKFDDGGVRPVNAHMKKVERTTGAEAGQGAFRFYYGDGPKDYVVADGMISAAGYDNSATKSFWSRIAGRDAKVETFMIEGKANQGFIAKGVKVNGVEQKGLYEFGPATGGLETKGLPGGEKSPRIETLGPRTQELAQRIRDDLLADPGSRRTCLTCGLKADFNLQPLARASTYEAETTMKVKGRGFRVRDEGQREMMIKAHLADTVESLGLPAGRSVDLTLVPDPVRGELAIRSRSLERDDLGRLQAALKRNHLAELLLSQPASKPNKSLSVTVGASDSGAVTISKADFIAPRRDPVVRLADDEVAVIGYGSLINKESMEKTLGRSLGEGKMYDIEVDGYRRTQNIRMRNESFYEELPNGARHYPEYIAYYNVEPAKGERMTATMFVIKRSELDGFHQREWIYSPTDVGNQVLGARVVKNSLEGKPGEAYIYVGKQEHMFDPRNPGDTRFRASYDDIVNSAVAKKDPGYQKAFRETTSDERPPVIADKKDATRRPMSDPVVAGSGAFVKYAMDEKTFVKLQDKLGYNLFPLKGKANLGGSLFRGMSVNPEQLERILGRGLELEKAMGGKFISTSKDASWAKLFQGRIGETSAERYVRILVEVDPKSSVARKAGPDTAMGKSDIAFTGDIPTKDIKAIYILDPSKSVNPWTRFTVAEAQKLRFEADLAKARATGAINILGRASDVGASVGDAEVARILGRDPFAKPELFRAGKTLSHSLDEKGRILARIEPGSDGAFRLSATNQMKADAGLDGRVPAGITDGLSVKVRGKTYGAGTPIPLRKGDVVDLELHGSLLGKYSFDGKAFGRMDYASRVVNVFDLSRFANEPEFVARVRAGKEKWNSFRPEAKTSSFSELHSHLSGAIEAEALVGIALKRGTKYPLSFLEKMFGKEEVARLSKNWKLVGDEVDLRSMPRRDLDRIIARIQISPEEITSFEKQLHAIYDYRWPLSKDPDAIADILHQTARELKASGVKFTQLSHGGGNFTPEYLAMLERELPKIERETGVKIQVMYGIVRRLPAEAILTQLDTFRNLKSRHVVGIDFLGEETESLQRLKDHGIGEKIAQIRKENPGVQIKFHAGEAPEFPENVRLAVEMGANRIGHGTFGFVNGAADETVRAIRRAASETPPRHVFVETQRGSNITLDYVRQGDLVREMDGVLRREGIAHGAYTDGHGIYGATPRGEFAITATSGGTVADLAKIRAYERRVFAESLDFEAHQVGAALAEARAAPSPSVARIRALETEHEALMVRRDAYHLHALMGEARPASRADARAYEAWFAESSGRLNRALDGLRIDDPASLAAARREIDEAARAIGERVEGAASFLAARGSEATLAREARITALSAKLAAADSELRAAEAAWAAYKDGPRPRVFSGGYDKAKARLEAATAARNSSELTSELPRLLALSRNELGSATLRGDPARLSSASWYGELARNPAATRRMLQAQGLDEQTLAKWDEVGAFAGKQHSVLAADPAIAPRGDEFLRFAARYLKENDGRSVGPWELRQAFNAENGSPAGLSLAERRQKIDALSRRESSLTAAERDELAHHRRELAALANSVWPRTLDEAFPASRGLASSELSASERRLKRVEELAAKPDRTAAETEELIFLRGEVAAEANAVWPKTITEASRQAREEAVKTLPGSSRASLIGDALSDRAPASALDARRARMRELASKQSPSKTDLEELAYLRSEEAATANAVWPKSTDEAFRPGTVAPRDTKLRAIGADLASTRDPALTAQLTRQAEELSHQLDAAVDSARRRFESVLASGEPVGTLEADLALREAQRAQRLAKLATDLDANDEPLVRAYKQALVREADLKDPAARTTALRALHDLEASIDARAAGLRAHLDDLRARVAVTSEPGAAALFGREADLAKARLARLESARAVFAPPQALVGPPLSTRASNLGGKAFQYDLKPPPFGRVVTEASRAEYYKSLPKRLVGDSAKPWKDTDELIAIGEKIRARARLGRIDPKATHIPELAAQVEGVLKGTRGAIESQEKEKLSFGQRLRSFFRGAVETKDERLNLMKSFEAEARARLAAKNVTYEWWHDFNHRTEILKTEAHNRTAVRGGATSRFDQALLEDGSWKTNEGYRATASRMEKRVGISEHDLTSLFPDRILMPTRSGDINVVPMNEMFGTNINPLGQIDRKVIADGREMYPDHFRGHDFVHASNENFIVGEASGRLSEFRRHYLAYRETLPAERRATFEVAYFIGTHEIPQIADSLITQGKAADVWTRINNVEEIVRSDQWLGNLVPPSARTGAGTQAFIAEMTREMDEFGAAIAPAMKETLAREDAVRNAERAVEEAARKEKALRDPITGKATPLATDERNAMNYIRELEVKRAGLAEQLAYGRENYGKEYAEYLQGDYDEASRALRSALKDFNQKGFAHAAIREEGGFAGKFRLKELGPDGKEWVELQRPGSPITSRQVAAGKPVAADALTEAKLADAATAYRKAFEEKTRVLALAREEKATEQARWLAVADGTPDPLRARASSVGDSVAAYRANYARLEPSAKRVVDFASALREREAEFAARELAAGSNKTTRELAREFARRGHVPEIAAQIDGMLADAKAAIERNKQGFLSRLRGRFSRGGFEDRLKILEDFRAEANARRVSGATYEWWLRFNERLDILKTPLAERSPELANRRSRFLERLLESDAWKTDSAYTIAAREFKDGRVAMRNAAGVYPDVVLVPSRDGEVGIRSLNELTGTNVHLVGKIASTEYVDGFHMNPIAFSDHDVAHASLYRSYTGEVAGYVTEKHFTTVRDEYFRHRDTLKGAARERFELGYHLIGHENPAGLARLAEGALDRDTLIRHFEGGLLSRRLMDAGDLGKEFPEIRKAGPAAVARFEKEIIGDLLSFQEKVRPRLTPLNAEFVAKNYDRLQRHVDVAAGLSDELERARRGGVEKEILQARRELGAYKAGAEKELGMPWADLLKVHEAGPPAPAYVAQIPTQPVVARAAPAPRPSNVSGLVAESVREVRSPATRRLAPAVAQARESLELARMQPLATARRAYLDSPTPAHWAGYRAAWDAYLAGVSSPDLAHRLAPDLASSTQAARTQSALRQELEHLALQSRVAERKLNSAANAAEKARYSGELAVLLGEKAQATAQLAPELAAKPAAKGRASSPLARFEQLRRNAYEIHAAEFGGIPYEQARRNPQLAEAINHLAARTAGEAKLASDATAEVSRAAKSVFGARADDRLAQLATLRRQGKAATPGDLRAAARAQGWSPAEIEGCVKQGLCASNNEISARLAAAAEATRAEAPVARELLASKAAGERPVPLSRAELSSAADIRRELAARRRLVDAEATAVEARLAKEGKSAEAQEALRAVRAAQDALTQHETRLAREATQVDSLLKRQRELGAGDSFVNRATGEITRTGRFAAANPKEIEAALKPAGDSKRAASRVVTFLKQAPEAIERKLAAAGVSEASAKALAGHSLRDFTGNPAAHYEAFVKKVSSAGDREAARVLGAVSGNPAAFPAEALAKVSDELKPAPSQRLAASRGDLAAQRALLEKQGLKADDIELCKAAGACLHERTPAETAAVARSDASEAVAKAVEPEARGRGLASAADPMAARIEGFKHADPDVYGLLKEAHEQSLRTNKPMDQSLESALKRQLKTAELNAEERQGLKDLLACLNP